MKIIKFNPVIIFMCSLMAACSSDVEDKFDQLCKEEAGYKINKTVTAEGFFDSTMECTSCWDFLMPSEYKYIEFCNKEPHPHFGLPEAGCYKIYKGFYPDKNCDNEITKEREPVWKEQYPDFPDSQCLAIIKIEKPSSLVRVRWTTEYVVNAIEDKTKIRKYTYEISLQNDDEIVAKQFDFDFVQRNWIAGGSSSYACNRKGIEILGYSKFLSRVILTK